MFVFGWLQKPLLASGLLLCKIISLFSVQAIVSQFKASLQITIVIKQHFHLEDLHIPPTYVFIRSVDCTTLLFANVDVDSKTLKEMVWPVCARFCVDFTLSSTCSKHTFLSITSGKYFTNSREFPVVCQYGGTTPKPISVERNSRDLQPKFSCFPCDCASR